MQKGVSLFAHKHFPYNSFHYVVVELFKNHFIYSSLVLSFLKPHYFSLLNLSYILCMELIHFKVVIEVEN
jgi:hypothetical protein